MGALALMCALAAPLRAQDMPPLEAYGALPSLRDVAISPSGDHLAIFMDGERGTNIAILDRDGEIVRAVNAAGLKVRSMRFAGDEALIIYKSDTVDVFGFVADKYEMTMAVVLPVDPAREVTSVFSEKRQLANAVYGRHGLRLVDGTWRGYYGAIVFERDRSGYHFDHGRPYLYEYDFSTGKHDRLDNAALQDKHRDWLIDANGRIAATFDIDQDSGKWTIKNSANAVIAEGRHPSGDVGLVGLGKDSTTLIYSAKNADTQENDWLELPLAGGAAVPFLPDVAIERTYWNRRTGEMLGYLERGEGTEPVFFDPALNERAGMIRRAFVSLNGRMVEWTPDLGRTIMRTNGNGDSGSWFMVDFDTMRAEPVGYDRPSISPAQVGEVSQFAYTAQDGLEMDGIVTIPPGLPAAEAKNLPLIVLPHGGPSSHDTVSFDWWAQAFASRGYAVFQPNFRGSTGRGMDFQRAGYGEWGAAMQTDISDGVAALAKTGAVDPARACIVGASYGGYAALAGVTIQQGLYRCAVSFAGVSDLRLMARSEFRESARSKLLRRSLEEELGPREFWRERSPRTFAERADAPVLLIHGRDDTVVLYEQSAKMADALDDAGKPYKLVELEGEDHWLSLGETRMQMLRETMAFVLEHNPPN